MTRRIPTAITLLALLTLQAQGLVFWAEELVYAETITIEGYRVSTATTPNSDKVWMKAFLWDVRFDKLVNWTVVEGRANAVDEISCRPPSGTPLSPRDKALCDAVRQLVEWLERNLRPPHVRVKASSANIKGDPFIQSPTITTVQHGTTLRKVGQEGLWIKVILDNSGEIGWIYGEQVEPA